MSSASPARFFSSPLLHGGRVVVDAANGARLGHAGTLGDAVGDEIHRVEAGHVLLLQEIGGVAFALGEDGDEHIGAGHLLAAGRLHMHDGAVNDALEAWPWAALRRSASKHEIIQLVVEIVDELSAQHVEIDIAGAHDCRGVAIVDQRQQQMFERRVLMTSLVGVLEARGAERFPGCSRTRARCDPTPFPWCTVGDADVAARSSSLAPPSFRRLRR